MPHTRPAALGIREKIIIAYIGLLVLLLLLAGVGLSITNVASNTFESQSRQENQSITYSADMSIQISEINSTAYFYDSETETDSALNETLEIAQGKIDAVRKDLKRRGNRVNSEDLVKYWNQYREGILLLVQQSNDDRTSFFTENVKPHATLLRRSLESIIEYNLTELNNQVEQNQTKARHSRFLLFGLAILGLILCIGFLGFLRKLLVSPAEEIVRTLNQIDTDELEAEFKYRRLDEIGRVAQAIQKFMVKIRERRLEDVSMFTQLEKRSELALNSIPDGIMVLNTEGEVLYKNHIATILSKAHGDGTRIENWKWNTVRHAFDTVLKSKEPCVNAELGQAIQFFMDGNEHYFLPSAYPLFKEDDELFEVVLLMNDVTFVQKLDEMKSDLMSTVSHQLKTPLTAMRMSLRMVMNSRNIHLPEMETELLQTANRESERLQNTIQELLDLARIQAGSISMKLEVVNPTEWLDHLVTENSHRFDQAGMLLHTHLAEDCPEVRIDHARMNAVIDNLLCNCVKYCDEGDHVEVRLECDPDDVQNVLISVKDNGPGMEPKDVKRIFDRFYRGSDTKQQGTGLGLSICREIVQAHGGEISCQSIKGEGTTFNIRLYPVDNQICDEE